MAFEEDLGVFFAPSDFARPFTLRRSGEADVVFHALFDSPDEVALAGHGINADQQLLYATDTVNLRDGDTLIDGGAQGIAAGAVWRVRGNPMRTGDGRTSTVLLSKNWNSQ